MLLLGHLYRQLYTVPNLASEVAAKKPPQDPKNKRRRLADVTGLRKDVVNRRDYAGLDI